MIYAEYILDGKFDHIETAVFSKLDNLVSRAVLGYQFAALMIHQFSNQSVSSAEPAARAWFVTELRHVFETGPTIDDTFHSKVGLFLEEIELFIALLDNVRELPDTPAWADERAAATYQMLDFIRRIGRDGLYIRFVHQLKDIFLHDKNWLSAGLTLKLHADMYEWKIGGDLLDECREGDLELPAQTQFQRKEAIYRQCLDYFGKHPPIPATLSRADRTAIVEAEAFEHALELSEEMSRQHRKTTWNVERLSESLRHQADLWGKMASTRRHKPEYYRVVSSLFARCYPEVTDLLQAFYGDYRPAVNQGKEYIFRGEPWQQFSDLYVARCHKRPQTNSFQLRCPTDQVSRSHTAQVKDAALATRSSRSRAGDLGYLCVPRARPLAAHVCRWRQRQCPTILSPQQRQDLLQSPTVQGPLTINESGRRRVGRHDLARKDYFDQ